MAEAGKIIPLLVLDQDSPSVLVHNGKRVRLADLAYDLHPTHQTAQSGTAGVEGLLRGSSQPI